MPPNPSNKRGLGKVFLLDGKRGMTANEINSKLSSLVLAYLFFF